VAADSGHWRSWEALAAVVLYTKDQQEQAKVCRELIQEFRDHENADVRMDLALMCSLAPVPGADHAKTNAIADGVLSELKARPFLNLAKGMSLYRQGRFDEALEFLPDADADFVGPKDEFLALLFRAMTHYQLGDAYTCRVLLNHASEAVQEEMAEPNGPMLPLQDRPVVWCMVHTVLREAQKLVGTGDDRLGEKTGEPVTIQENAAQSP